MTRILALRGTIGFAPLGRLARLAGLAAALGSVVLVASPVRAQEKALSEPDKVKAKEAYEKATRFYNVGRYAEAIEEYQNVYLITADAAMLVNIAQAYRLSEQLPEAARFYKRYLSTAPADAPGRAFAEKRLAEVEKLIEDRKKTGGAPPPANAPPTVAPGPVAPALAPGPPTAPPAVSAAPPAPAAVPSVPPAGPGPIPVAERPSRVLPVTLLVAGGVLLAGSAGFALWGQSKEDELENAAKKTQRFDPKVQAAGNTANGLAVLTGALGLAAGVTGAVLLFRTPSNPEPGTAQTGSGGRLAAVTPVVAPGFAGASVQVVF